MDWGAKPVIVIGYGIRAADADPARLLTLGVPVLSSWLAADLVDNFHHLYFGSPGIYGQRAANKILYEADSILAIGNRMCAWQIGHAGLRPEQRLAMVDCDWEEVGRHKNAVWINTPIADFIAQIPAPVVPEEWLNQCHAWANQYPLIEAAHADTNGYINSYRLMTWLSGYLNPDEHIVVDDGSIICPVFQAMRFKPPQRVMTAGCLGEMGCGLPGAVGAAFARPGKRVIAVIGDGGMMMNLQELATVAYHKLPIKMLVFANDGYSMIKGTFNNVGRERVGVSAATGLGLPDFAALAKGFGIANANVRSWHDAIDIIPAALASDGPYLVQVHIDPEQEFVPRLKPIKTADGFRPARFDTLSPIL